MRIALVGARSFPAQHGGIELAVEGLAEAFAARGHETHVFVSEIGDGWATTKNHGIRAHSSWALSTKHLHTASQVLSGWASVSALKPDVVHIHGVGPAFPLAILRSPYGKSRTVVTSHGLDWERAKWSPIARAVFRKISTRALSRCDAITAVSASVSHSLEEMVGRRVAHIGNGLNPLVLEPWPGSLPRSYTVASSRLTPEKNIEYLIDSYTADVQKELGPLLIVGGGGSSHSANYEEGLRRQAPPWVHLLGALPRPQALYVVSKSDRFVSASKLEAQPISVIEAMALGKPLYLSSIDTHLELAGVAAEFFRLDDKGALSAALMSPLRQGTEPIRALKALEISQGFSWTAAADQYLALYEDTLKRRPQ